MLAYPKPSGNQCSVTEKSRSPIRARKKYGKAEMITKSGGRTLSRMPPRRQAAAIPTSVPAMKASTVVVPTRPRVQGRAENTTLDTGSGKKVSDDTEVARHRVAQIDEVLPEGTLAVVHTEGDLQGFQRLSR